MTSLGEPPKRRARSSKRRLADATAELERISLDGADDPPGLDARHLVALYARLHRAAYKVDPGELADGQSFLAACSAASKLVREEFGGRTRGAIEYLRWTWRRERSVLARRAASGEETVRRIGWKLQFASRSLLTDYRADLAVAAERGPRR